jgi:hypothetical protein
VWWWIVVIAVIVIFVLFGSSVKANRSSAEWLEERGRLHEAFEAIREGKQSGRVSNSDALKLVRRLNQLHGVDVPPRVSAYERWLVLEGQAPGEETRWGQRRRDEAQTLERDTERMLRECDGARWRVREFQPGHCRVHLVGLARGADTVQASDHIVELLRLLPGYRDRRQSDLADIVKRTMHISAHPIAEDISERDAIDLKELIERWGGRVKIEQGFERVGAGKRESIPQRVRSEVWQRDGGTCVDCASRERLEYDHIIPVVRGGANTARNIELRCEACNRRKAARI